MTVQIIEFHGDEKRYVDALLKAQQRTQELEAELKKASKASQDAAGAVGDAFKQTEQEQARVMNALRAQLRAIGPEGQAAAKAMAESMATNGQSSEEAVGNLLDKIKLIDPVAAEAARAGFQTAKDEMAEASRFGEGAFQKPLDKLRAMGPEGRKAAELLKAHLVEAGKITERSFTDVIDEIRKIDPAAAEAAAKIQGDLKDAAEESGNSWDNFGKRAISAVTALSASYLSFSSTVQLVNQYLEQQAQLKEKLRDQQVMFGAAQQSTLANLAGMSKSDQEYLVGDAISSIARDAKFGDRTKIMQAIGAVASAGVDDKGEIVRIVTEAARMTNLNPDQLKGNAVSAAAIMQQAGLANPKEALALATTAGPLSKIEDLSRLARVLPVALSAVGANTQGLTPQQAAKEGTAMFSLVGQAAQDELGESTRTFMVGFSTKISTFFKEITENRAKAMDDVASIEERIAKGKETETDKLNLPKLRAFLAESENLKDSGGLISRVEQLQQLPAVAALFKDKTTVEQQFQPSLDRLLNPNDPLLGQIKEGVGKLSTDAAFYDDFSNRMQAATSQIKLGTRSAISDASTSGYLQSNADIGKLAQIEKIMKETNEATSVGIGFGDWANRKLNNTDPRLAFQTDPATAAVGSILRLKRDNTIAARDGISAREQSDIQLRNAQAENILALLEDSSPEGARRGREIIQQTLFNRLGKPSDSIDQSDPLINRMIELLERIAGNTLGQDVASAPSLSGPP